MAVRKCPECGASVKLENLERHVSSVHPGRSVPVELSKEERREIRTQRPGRANPTSRNRMIAGVALVVLVIASVGAVSAYLPRAPPGHPPVEFHIHVTLSITIDGVPREVSAYIGIEPALWRDHALDSYGMAGMSPLHTHDGTGLIHVESHGVRDYSLGEFFSIWGQPFDSTHILDHTAGPGHQIRLIVNGVDLSPNPALVFNDGMRIQITCTVG